MDLFILYFVYGTYGLILFLILLNIELNVGLIGRIKCRFGKHRHAFRLWGRIVSRYRCKYCGKPKDHPHLRLIDGGKKDLDITFKF